MLLSDRRTFLIGLAATSLAGCGFEPVYKQGGAARDLFGEIEFELIETREGFEMLERLEGRLGAGDASSRFLLAINLETTEEGLAISSENAITRFNVLGTATISVRERLSDEVVFSDALKAITAYSATSSTASTASARRDAYRRLAHALADRIITRVAATSQSWAA